MQDALVQAQRAYESNEVPVGAIVVSSDGAIIGKAYNQTEEKKTQGAHAEMQAMKQAGEYVHNWRLQGCWLYVTLQPCAMCMHMIQLSRMSGVAFAAFSPLFGYHLDNINSFRVYKKDAICLIRGICQEESRTLLRTFFKEKRRNM
jgi:tRNA(adenine34) deaminase